MKREDGRVWLKKGEIAKLQKGRERIHRGLDNRQSTYIDASIDNGETVSVHEEREEAIESEERPSKIYKELYKEVQEELRTKQKQLEGANYRVGHLEAQLKDTVPLLDFQKAMTSEKALKKDLEGEVKFLKGASEDLKQKVKEEKINKMVYLIILFILMALQPLWLYLAFIK
ncbi:hypothetical protein ACFL2V_11600 [Pseudomonadota bacterium]